MENVFIRENNMFPLLIELGLHDCGHYIHIDRPSMVFDKEKTKKLKKYIT